MCSLIGYFILWTLFGVFILIWVVLNDTWNFIEILSMTNGCKAHHGLDHTDEEEEELDEEQLAQIYNEIRGICYEMYKEQRA